MLAIAVALLLGPLLSLALARALRPILKWLRPVEGALAADSLIQAPRRTSASVAALMLSLALVVAFAGMARASYVSIIDWMETALNPDLFVMPSQDIVIRTMRFPPTMGPELSAMAGVERVQMVRERQDRLPADASHDRRDRRHAASAETAHRPPVEGDAAKMYRLTAAGQGLDGVRQSRPAPAADARRRPRDSRRRTASSGSPSSASCSTTPTSRGRS